MIFLKHICLLVSHKAGIDLVVMCPGTAPHRGLLLAAGIPVIDLEPGSRLDRAATALIRKQLMAKKVDILHAFNNKAVSNSLIATRGYPCKIIAYRGIEGNVSYYDPMSWMTYLHPRVDVIVCVADAIRRYFCKMRLFGFPLPVSKAITIYKGHDPGWYDTPAVDLTTFGIPQDAFYVGCTVNDRPRKGLRYLIEAANLLPEGLPVHFILIGNIKNRALLAQIEKTSYAANIHLPGFQKDAHRIIKSCDICILPALKREGLPKGIIEGMIQGVAPIVSDSGGSPELVEHGKSGLIVKSGSAQAIADAIIKLYADKKLLQLMKQQAAERIKNHFTIGETISKHLTLYQSL